MRMRLATFNVENLFSRARAINVDDPAVGRGILNDIAELNFRIAKPAYSSSDKAAIKEILERNQVTRPSVRPFLINEVRGRLFKGGANNITVTAAGRSAWVGWVDSERDVIPIPAIERTAEVIAQIDADVLCLVEIESRPALQDFNDEVINRLNLLAPEKRYTHNMLIDGNDERGIDVAILSRFPIRNMRSHIDDPVDPDNPAGSRVFSRDCPEYELVLPEDAGSLWLLCNHFVSKRGGDNVTRRERRRKQAARVNEILQAEFNLSTDLVVVAGDLNDSPDSQPLQPLLSTPNLKDVLDSLPPGTSRGTFGNQQIDYLLVSQPLSQAITNAKIERHDLANPAVPGTERASDHAAVFVDFDI